MAHGVWTSRNRWLLVGAGVVALLVAGLVGGLIGASVHSSSKSTTASQSCAVTPVADKVLPSVVTIATVGGGGSGTGSGEIVRGDGYILTNNHVISTAADQGGVQVLFADGTSASATISGRDPQTDLAVLKVPATHPLPVIELGSSTAARVGDQVVALGAPLGLSGTVTSGIISARDRTVQVPGEADRTALLVSALQTDAAINPGNSGGALVDCTGRLIGVPTAGASVPNPSGQAAGGSIGVNFAIPIDFAKPIFEEIIATGRARHAFFGLQTVPIPAAAARQAGVTGGLFVNAVSPGGPAARAGLRDGDVITAIDGAAATSNEQLAILTLTKQPGDRVPITFVRGGQQQQTTITLAVQP